MAKILIVSHANLAAALLESAAMIAGDLGEQAAAIGLETGESPEQLEERVRAFLDRQGGEDLLVFTDLVSGTPFNVVGSLMQHYDFQHLSGVNLGILLEASLLLNDLPLPALTAHLVAAFPGTFLDVTALMKE